MNKNKLHFKLTAPLNDGDTECQTYGCRANNPDICKYYYLENVCAYASDDHLCKHPSLKWEKYYRSLSQEEQND